MIKLLHTADWHLGKMFFGRSMLEDQEYFIDNYFFPVLEELGFGPGAGGCHDDCVVLAGDIFDRAVPPVAALGLFDNVITRIARMGIKLFAITGNHDGAARLSMGARIMRGSGIYLYTSLSNISEALLLDDRVGCRVMLHPLPHFDIYQGRAFLGGGECAKYSECFDRIISKTDISDRSAVHVLAAHCTAFPDSWKNNNTGSGPDNEDTVTENADNNPDNNGNSLEKAVGGSDEIDINSLGAFDLALLGHFHSDIDVTKKAAYSGSPLGYSFDRTGVVRSMRYYEIGKSGINMKKIPVDKPLHPLRRVSGSFDHLLSDETPRDDAFIYAQLDDTSLIYEPMMRLREKFPNILGLCYSSEAAGGLSAGYRDRLRASLHSRSVGDSEVFEAFLRQMCAVEPSGEDLEMFGQLCREAFAAEDAV